MNPGRGTRGAHTSSVRPSWAASTSRPGARASMSSLMWVTTHRAALDCRRLVVTHMSEDMLARAPGLDVEAAHDGLTLEV